jgi:hypothetical protein
MGDEVYIKTTTVRIRDTAGVWYYAGRSLLETYGFPRGNERYQGKLVNWLKEHNGGKIGADGYFILGDGGVDITVPADENSVAFIILPRGKGSTAGESRGEQYLDLGTKLVLEVEGAEEALPGGKAEYKVSRYHKDIKEGDKGQVRWAVKVDGKEETLEVRGSEVSIEIKQEWAGKEIVVIGFLNNPDEKISRKTNVIKWELPI